MTDEEERADQKAIECKFAYTDLCSLQIQWRLELQMDCVAMQCIAMHCILLYRLYLMMRLKWEQSHANAADRGDRVQSV